MNQIKEENYFNIFPVFDRIVNRTAKEKRLQQRAKVIWLTGLSGSGKSTLASGLERELFRKGYFTQVVDGDNLRDGLNTNLGFTDDDRVENIRRIAEISKLIMNCGVITICACISPTDKIRRMAYDIIGRRDVIEVFVDTPIGVCEQRDVKGLYARARRNEIHNFTGIHVPYEKPASPALTIDTTNQSVTSSVSQLLHHILPHITF